MNILVIGSGGREHAIVKKLIESPHCDKIFAIPGNAGICGDADCIDMDVNNIAEIADFAEKKEIGLTVVGPEIPLVEGIADKFKKRGLKIFGPGASGARLEGSKAFSKEFMAANGIPTATFEIFSDSTMAINYLNQRKTFPVVVKADGLAAGKGVLICKNREEAIRAVVSIMDDRIFGNAGEKIVIEDFLAGTELSILAFTDGKTVLPMISAKDYKKAGEGDSGLNTGGMGAISPNPIYTPDLAEKCFAEVFLPTVKGLEKSKIDFKGILYFGLMVTGDKINVLEYNVRMGDPETQVVLPRLKTDLVDVMMATIEGRLSEVKLSWDERSASTIVAASKGYPESYEKGKEITGLDEAEGVTIYHAGTKLIDGRVLTSGGRVLAVTTLAETLEASLGKGYNELKKIHFDGIYYRRDIGI